MKKVLFAITACAALAFSSCTTIEKTATTVPMSNHVEIFPTVTDLDVKDKVEATTSWGFNFFGTNPSLDQRKSNFIAKTLKEKDADILLEPQFIYTKRGIFGRRTLTLTGFPAKYKGFRKATPADIEALETQDKTKYDRVVYSTDHSVEAVNTETPKKTQWIVRGGMNVMKYAGSDADGLDSKIGYDFSIEMNKPLGGVKDLYWGMEFGLGSRGWSSDYHDLYDDEISFKESEMRHNIRYSPFILGYKHSFSKDFAIDPHLGAFVSVDYTGNYKREHEGETEKTSLSDFEENFYRWDAGIRLGVGFWYKNFNLDFAWQRGFAKTWPDAKAYTSNFMIRLGVAF